MTTKYFTNCKNLDDLKARYESLTRVLHLDLADSDNPLKKEINEDAQVVKSWIEKRSTPKESQIEDLKLTLRDIIRKVNSLHLDGEICGKWIWIFNPIANRYSNDLKSLGFRYSDTKKAFYWRDSANRSSSTSPIPINEIRDKYGSERI